MYCTASKKRSFPFIDHFSQVLSRISCMCGDYFESTGHQPGMVVDPASGQLNCENERNASCLRSCRKIGYYR